MSQKMESKLQRQGDSLDVTVDNTPAPEGFKLEERKESYVDPINQEYIVERSNIIAAKTFLVPEVWDKKDLEHNLRLH